MKLRFGIFLLLIAALLLPCSQLQAMRVPSHAPAENTSPALSAGCPGMGLGFALVGTIYCTAAVSAYLYLDNKPDNNNVAAIWGNATLILGTIFLFALL